LRKKRIDELLAGRELAQDLKEARALLMAGLVFSGSRRLDKAGELLSEDAEISVRSKEHPYVSRGGLKLAHALQHWKLDLRGLRCLDMGASTGGFTHCLLLAGAARVYAVDSGTNQLDWSLRQDPRVQSMEQSNARELQAEHLGGSVDFVCMDLSFIKLEKVFPALLRVLSPGGTWVALVKPQFEAAKHEVPEGGVIIDADLRLRLCAEVFEAAAAAGLGPKELIESPITGRDGNVEFLMSGRTT
jgi:23S rRNA (cytidine1920-2'-O)/16S rRNA (cytidine1409-2'-O)-methyltransferase